MEEEKPYKVYKGANGQDVVFTKEDFDAIVECFRILKSWRDELRAKQKAEAETKLNQNNRASADPTSF